MFSFFGGQQKRIQNQFKDAWKAALKSPDMHERVAAARLALGLLGNFDPWPPYFLPKQRTIGVLHTALGRAYLDLRFEDPPLYSSSALEELKKATEYLTPSDGTDWGWAMMNLSIAYADSLDSNHGDNIELAIEAAQAALTVLERKRDRQEWIGTTANLAGYYAERHRGSQTENIEKSIQLHEAALEEVNKYGSPLQQARLLAGLGGAHAQRRRYDKEHNIERAIEYIEKALTVLSLQETPAEWAMAQENLSIAYAERIRGDKRENFQRAIEANTRCLKVFEMMGQREKWARAQMTRSILFEDCPYGDPAMNLRERIKARERALSVFSPEEYPEEYARISQALDHAQSLQHDNNRAGTLEGIIEKGEGILLTFSAESDPDGYAAALVHLGNAYPERVEGNRSENMERSIELLERAVTLFDQRASPIGWGGAMNSLAQSYNQRVEGLRADNIEKAMALSEAALVVVSNLTDPEQHSAILETLGDGFSDRVRGDHRENLEKALQIYDTASKQRNRDHNPEAWLRLEQKYLHAERVLHSLKASERSSATEQSIDVEQDITDLHNSANIVSVKDYPRTWMAAQIYLADTYTRIPPANIDIYDTDLFAEAICASCQKALDIYASAIPVAERLGDKFQRALLQERIGAAYGFMHLFTDIQREHTTKGPEAQSKYAEKAHHYYLSAIAAHTAALEIYTLERSPRRHLSSAAHIGRLHTYERNWAAAEERFESAALAADKLLGTVELSESDMKDVLTELGGMATLAPFASLMLNKPARAVELAEIGRARLLAKALTLESLPMSPEVRNKLHDLQREVAMHERHLVSPRLFDRWTPLEESIRLRKEIQTLVEHTNLADRLKGFATAALDDLVKDGSVVVIPVLTEAGGRLMICRGRGGTPEIHVAECPAESDIKKIFNSHGLTASDDWQQQYLQYQQQRIPDDILNAIGNALGEAFATPLVQALESLGIEQGSHLDILPQGLLGILPIGLARDKHYGLSLMELYEISLSPSLTALFHAKKRAYVTPVSVVALSNPDDSLKFARIESSLLRNWFSDDHAIYMEGRAVSREEIIKALPERDVWHFATHGLFNPSAPLQSSLMIGKDDFLTLEMLFETSGLGSPRLVVLSACKSGLYDLTSFPNEFIGLSSGFLQAGAAGVIGTLWPVDDLSTALLIGRFYEGYIGHGLAPSAALRAAQFWLRKASREEMINTLSRWRNTGHISSTDVMVDALNGAEGEKTRDPILVSSKGDITDNINRYASEFPFASPFYWSGFVHYGA